ncbi:MAG: hypothetical protein WB566_07990 [Terriglobales bacterium]
MSIAPVLSFPPPKSEQTENANVRHNQSAAQVAPSAAEEPAHPVSVTLPKQENSTTKNAPSSYEPPEDVVEVHQDPDIKNQVIVEYLDKGKNVVFQVPSSEELGVERGIAQDVEEAAKLRASEIPAAGSEERNHGD